MSTKKIVAKEMELEYTCADCGEVYLTLDREYVSRYPNGSDMAREQAMLRHQAHECPFSEENDHVVYCDHCGEEIWRGDCEYMSRYPNGSDIAIGQAIEQHEGCCAVLWSQYWDQWRQDAGAKEGETPFGLLKRKIKQGQSLALFKTPCPPDREEESWHKELCQIKREIEASL